MPKCRGCGNDTTEMLDGGPGPMHYRCEIERLSGLYDEANSMCEILDAKVERLEAEDAELRRLMSVHSTTCSVAKGRRWGHGEALAFTVGRLAPGFIADMRDALDALREGADDAS